MFIRLQPFFWNNESFAACLCSRIVSFYNEHHNSKCERDQCENVQPAHKCYNFVSEISVLSDGSLSCKILAPESLKPKPDMILLHSSIGLNDLKSRWSISQLTFNPRLKTVWTTDTNVDISGVFTS